MPYLGVVKEARKEVNGEEGHDEEPQYLEEGGSQKDHRVVLNHPEAQEDTIILGWEKIQISC